MSDVDGNVERRGGTKSAFHSAEPEIHVAAPDDEHQFIVAWLGDRLLKGLQPHDIAIFVRSDVRLAEPSMS